MEFHSRFYFVLKTVTAYDTKINKCAQIEYCILPDPLLINVYPITHLVEDKPTIDYQSISGHIVTVLSGQETYQASYIIRRACSAHHYLIIV